MVARDLLRRRTRLSSSTADGCDRTLETSLSVRPVAQPSSAAGDSCARRAVHHGRMAVIDKGTDSPRALDREQLMGMLPDMVDCGSIELKVSVPPQKRTAMGSLGLDVLNGRIREVYFFDTPDLTLFPHGVVPRAR